MTRFPSRLPRTLVLLGFLSVAVRVGAQQPAPKTPVRTPGPKAGDTPHVTAPPHGDHADRLAEARQAAKAITGKRGEERDQAIRQAIAAYDQARSASKDSPAIAGEASYRMGELLLRLKESEKASHSFEEAFALAHDTFGARALLELGHIARRSHRLDDAVKAYERAEKEYPATARAMDARLWVGRTELERKAYDKARESFQQVNKAAKDPIDRIEAADWTARSFIRERRLDEAQAAIEQADKEFHELAASDERDGPRVRRALEHMGARDSLERAKARLLKGGKDADAGSLDDEDGAVAEKKKSGR